jgi:hypothetical protein
MVPSRFLNLNNVSIGPFSGIYKSGAVDLPATTTIADVTAGGTVSTLSSGTIALEEGEFYMWQACQILVGAAGGASQYINGDTTAANHREGYVQATTVIQKGDSSWVNTMTCASGGMNTQQGIMGLQNGTPYTLGQQVAVNTTNRARITGVYHPTETDFTEFQFDDASAIGAGSFLKIWKINQTPLVDVSVSGASVSSLSTGAFTLSAGKSYMLVSGFNFDASETGLTFAINNDTTAANYKRGKIASNAVQDTTGPATIVTSGASFGATYGFMGLENSTPFTNLLAVQENSVGRGSFQSVYNTSETTFTSLVANSATGSNIADGSRIRIYELGGV